MESSFLVKKVNKHLELNTQRPPLTRRGRVSPAHSIYQYVATLFPNEASLLRLASAVLSEISDEWETGKFYLNMKAQ